MDGPQSGQSRESGRSVQKWTILSQTGRSFEPKWMVQDDSGRSFELKFGHWSKLTVIRQKVGGPDELKDKSVRS